MSVFPGLSGSYLPNFKASGELQIAFTRNPSAFALNRYAQIRPTDKTVGMYVEIDTAEASRFIASGEECAWPDGSDRPKGRSEMLTWKEFRSQRFDYPWELGDETREQADFDIGASHLAIHAHKAMTARTARAAAILSVAGSYPSGHSGTATAVGGGLWKTSTAANAYIKKSFNAAAQQILLATNGVVQAKDLICVVDPVGARTITESPEYSQYLINNPEAVRAAQYDDQFNLFGGLLPRLFGFTMVVEQTPITTTVEGHATPVKRFLYSSIPTSNAVACFLSRPGGLVGAANVPSFASLSLFMKEDCNVEQMDDRKNRRVEGHVVDHNVPKMTAGAASYLVTNIDA